jgi:glucose-6-phosphate isomerase
VAELLDEAELFAPSLAGDADNPALALGVALGTAGGPVRLVSDGTGFEGFGDWATELLDGIVQIGPGGQTITYGGALSPAAVPGGGTRPDVAVNGPLGAQFLAWQYAAALAARMLGKVPFPVN